MKAMIAGNTEYRKLWAKVIKTRKEIGYPYILFKDNANVGLYKELGEEILHSNLCQEIMLPNNIRETFVCCLGSINLLHYDEWKDTDAIETYIYFLDAVITDFLKTASALPGMGRAIRFARRHRALGLGVLGYHSLLQSKFIPFESMEAKRLNNEVFTTLRNRSDKATEDLADMFGRAPILEGTKHHKRNTTTLAIAPTKSSSFILDKVSMGIEPIKSNYFIKDLAKIKSVCKNPFLIELLKKKKKNTDAIWDSILAKDGSVQHLEFLTELEKEVFKTFIEITPLELVQQAAQRQKYIDQGQSLNLMIHPSVSPKDINKLYIEAWASGIKSLYYQFSQSAAQSFSREINDCVACES
jgi:ribonucleoside-diphosphate reductase alpha chain